jgi:ketosteroid isomerase-like protein
MRPKDVAVRFNECINRRDLGGLAELMTEDHAFTDTVGEIVAGKPACLDAWRGFFEQFPTIATPSPLSAPEAIWRSLLATRRVSLRF